MIQVRVFLLLLVCFCAVYAGSKCPKRREIYPCTCIDMRLHRRKTITTVTCTGIKNSDHLNSILITVQNMDIDRFVLYDSFWETNLLGASGAGQRVLPNDWISLTNIKEMEIHDTTLSSCFACNWTTTCRNSVTTSFKVVNSTSSDKMCPMCTISSQRVPWMGCMSKLADFQLSHGNLKSVTKDFFPLSLRELISLDFSHNQIGKIDANAFRNLPNLQRLDVSHNAIEHIDHTFGQSPTKIEYLDLSYNRIAFIGSVLIPLMPKLRIVSFAHNQIVDFKQSDWMLDHIPENITSIDLTDNPINCDCSLKWLNGTMPVHVVIPGKCATPDEYKDSRFRPTSRNLMERCSPSGVLGTRSRRD